MKMQRKANKMKQKRSPHKYGMKCYQTFAISVATLDINIASGLSIETI